MTEWRALAPFKQLHSPTHRLLLMDDAPFTTVADSRPHRPERVPRADLPRLFGTCAWFRALAAEHQAMVLASAHAERLEGGAWIARRQEPSDYWIGVHSGLIKLAIYNASGRSCTLSGVPPGGWFGEGSVIKRELRKYDVATSAPRFLGSISSPASCSRTN